ncbi:hypothetical protein OGATHE_005774 [Ogataea polymorpha]|uniref:Uncharacterized protein n=1 Tax=Ogataea polymorpha TaxID=460523 RepID=A0A9P8NVD1_9ASCO|nr:hypothetical protein OGATHE_005774 [Ogataea polymorpha]
MCEMCELVLESSACGFKFSLTGAESILDRLDPDSDDLGDVGSSSASAVPLLISSSEKVVMACRYEIGRSETFCIIPANIAPPIQDSFFFFGTGVSVTIAAVTPALQQYIMNADKQITPMVLISDIEM